MERKSTLLIVTVETSFKDQDSAIFTDTSSTQGGVANVIDKISKSLLRVHSVQKEFQVIRV
jgi:hypothetical protein